MTNLLINHCVLQVFIRINKSMQPSRQSNQGVLSVTASMIIVRPYTMIIVLACTYYDDGTFMYHDHSTCMYYDHTSFGHLFDIT